MSAANLQLEKAISPRRLTPKQVQELQSLKQYSGRAVNIRSYSNDAEGFLLGTQILQALSQAHIATVDNRFTMQAGTEVFLGVSLDGPDHDLVKKLGSILSEDGLTNSSVISRSSGVSVRVTMGEVRTGATAAQITVGLKPIK